MYRLDAVLAIGCLSLLHAAQLATAAFPPHKKLTNSLVESCKFSIGEHNYDLCPLFSSRRRNEWTLSMDRSTPPTEETISYRIALDGPLKLNGTLPKHEQVGFLKFVRWGEHLAE